ncbi:hypothetical protein QVD17_03716 [Tagetes erecta]|uniref:B box-type domain-containing protein n=1 Tax=Tagetes erecta TaxID=13708 RepID=A0AAD8LEW2_TARER|nr:hypothetical protein QVD17_03716 [Tagetes erecta]
MMKSCELCKSPATVYCDSDQARLCWTCDTKVHSANFLVARHSRSLLCRLCQSPTPWSASGENLGTSAVSICEKCVGHAVSDADDEYEGDEQGENEFHVQDDDDVEEEEDGGENQVVPLSNSPPPATSSSSSSDDYSVGDGSVLMKRKRENDDVECLSVQKRHREPAPEFSKPIEVNGGTLYQFLPLNSEAMGEKLTISGEKGSGVCNGRRTVGLDLNS